MRQALAGRGGGSQHQRIMISTADCITRCPAVLTANDRWKGYCREDCEERKQKREQYGSSTPAMTTESIRRVPLGGISKDVVGCEWLVEENSASRVTVSAEQKRKK